MSIFKSQNTIALILIIVNCGIFNSAYCLELVLAGDQFSRDVIDVKLMNAKGDGETDDSDAIQKAVDKAGVSGGIVYFPVGKYLITKTLIPAANIIITGAGKNSLLQYDFPPHSQVNKVFYGWHFTDQKNVTFSNLAMDGGARNYNSDPVDADGAHFLIYFNPINDRAVENITITNCYFSGSFDSGIQSYGRAAHPYPHPLTNNIKIDKCDFRDLGSHGVGMNEWINSSVTNCYFNNVGMRAMVNGYGSGMAVDVSSGSENIIVSGNTVENAAAGFKAETNDNNGKDVASNNIIIVNNIIRKCKSGPEFLDWYGIRVNGKNVTVKGNIIESFMHGILLAPKSENAVIEANQILGTSHPSAVGIRIDNSYGNHIITGNQIMNAAAQGIMASGNSLLISNNRVSNCGLDGIRIGDADGVVCTQNIFKNNNGQGIAVGPISAQTNNILIANNMNFDDRESDSRKQQRGIYIAPEKTVNVMVSENLSFNNTVSQEVKPVEKTTDDVESQQKTTVKMSSSPTSGEWKVGDIVYNSSPGVGKFIGWVCVKDGTPGQWKPFGLIVP